ncbi:unnamed protein product, partial [Lampetra fluviatilis]
TAGPPSHQDNRVTASALIKAVLDGVKKRGTSLVSSPATPVAVVAPMCRSSTGHCHHHHRAEDEGDTAEEDDPEGGGGVAARRRLSGGSRSYGGESPPRLSPRSSVCKLSRSVEQLPAAFPSSTSSPFPAHLVAAATAAALSSSSPPMARRSGDTLDSHDPDYDFLTEDCSKLDADFADEMVPPFPVPTELSPPFPCDPRLSGSSPWQHEQQQQQQQLLLYQQQQQLQQEGGWVLRGDLSAVSMLGSGGGSGGSNRGCALSWQQSSSTSAVSSSSWQQRGSGGALSWQQSSSTSGVSSSSWQQSGAGSVTVSSMSSSSSSSCEVSSWQRRLDVTPRPPVAGEESEQQGQQQQQQQLGQQQQQQLGQQQLAPALPEKKRRSNVSSGYGSTAPYPLDRTPSQYDNVPDDGEPGGEPAREVAVGAAAAAAVAAAALLDYAGGGVGGGGGGANGVWPHGFAPAADPPPLPQKQNRIRAYMQLFEDYSEPQPSTFLQMEQTAFRYRGLQQEQHRQHVLSGCYLEEAFYSSAASSSYCSSSSSTAHSSYVCTSSTSTSSSTSSASALVLVVPPGGAGGRVSRPPALPPKQRHMSGCPREVPAASEYIDMSSGLGGPAARAAGDASPLGGPLGDTEGGGPDLLPPGAARTKAHGEGGAPPTAATRDVAGLAELLGLSEEEEEELSIVDPDEVNARLLFKREASPPDEDGPDLKAGSVNILIVNMTGTTQKVVMG